ncbi:MAG: methylenetetrahydrofolate reductase [Bacillota bacterium]
MQEFRSYIEAGEFVITAEIEPPKGSNLERTIEHAKSLAGKVHAVNITDSPMANMRMSPIAVAHVVREETDLDAIFHLTCRDRNVIGLQSELLGAAALGVKTILILTGDHPERGDHPFAQGVYEVDSLGLVEIADRLNQGYDCQGNKLAGSTQFYIGVAANPCARDLDMEIWRLTKKIERGAQFVQTQPVYEMEVLYRFINKIKHLNVPVIAGILPLKSEKMAKHLEENVPGVHIPEWLVEQLRERGRVAGVEAARELLAMLPEVVQGAHIMPVGSRKIALEVIEGFHVTGASNVGLG